MNTIRAARTAMATRFEVVLHGNKESWLQSVAEEVLDEIEKLDAKLSLYNPASQIARANRQAAITPVKVDPLTFGLLQRCAELSEKTHGAFDITMGPLIQCWGFMKGTGACPSEDAIERARALVGMHHVHLDPSDYTVRFDKEGVMLDLGAVGKGYALEVASEILLDYGIESGIIHGGTSTISAIGKPPEDDAWHIAVIKPERDPAFPYYVEEQDPQSDFQSPDILTVVPLINQSLSVSAVWGKSFQTDNRTFGHVIDGRSGQPAKGHWMAGLVCDNTTDSDALSTAMLVDGFDAVKAIQSIHPEANWLLVNQGESESEYEVHLEGLKLKDEKTNTSKDE
ncbi:MAG: FAD:protein FMN transferase [Verrucomicrobia bacterium]|nr:FAD:protein FMN transferase [Verrucomicrobiota bacterium]